MLSRFHNRLPWRSIIVAFTVAAIIAIVIIINWQPLVGFFGDQEKLKATVEGVGPWGPLAFMAIQFLQVVIAPIPGQATGVIAGALFGPWLGALYSLTGAALGCLMVFVLSRRLGRPFVERFVEAKHLKKFDRLTTESGPMVFFLIFLLPGFPDDIICYLAGLSAIPIRTLVIVSILGRAPGYVISGFLGAGIGDANGPLIGLIVGLIAIGAAVSYWKRTAIAHWARSFTNESEDNDGGTI
jgi:uncharacterized membrane protein YdjX (TVP38/TMEM64 family)